MSLVTGFLVELLAEGDINVALAASVCLECSVGRTLVVAQHHGSAERLHVHLLLGSAVVW